ncbi:MAG: UDP-2,4-diacetamido-2,4,6-trideoxy-beta-L-altropyranose hydrolase [Magnetospirillum sp.]|nr:UDP-2,4-diacetamido-2,4,6-trideoxy-beta-L-altropyranose hydrolase [Magnetospirillum sp.]
MAAAVFRCDASPTIGGGHVMRCLTLAQALMERGWRVAFAVADGTARTVSAVMRPGVTVVELPPAATLADEAALTMGAMPAVDLLVVDHYGRDAAFERLCRSGCRQIAVIDDLADRHHDCDLLIDQSLDRSEADYRPLVGPRARLLLGPGFAMLRPDFARLRPSQLDRRGRRDRPTRMLISLGASDPHRMTLTATLALAALGWPLEVDIVVGRGDPSWPEIERVCGTSGGRARLLVDVAGMAGLMAAADLALGAAGTTAWERCCLGLPTLMIATADNQTWNAATLSAHGACTYLGAASSLGIDDLTRAFTAAFADNDLSAKAESAARICDGLGAGRVALAIDGGARDLWLRPVGLEDEERLFQWQSDAATRRHFRNPRPPTGEEHAAWLRRRIGSTEGLIDIIMLGSEPAGTVRLDRHHDASGDPCAYEVSIVVAPARRGTGIGPLALRTVSALVPWAALWAEIHPDNVGSRRAFTAAGFSAVDPVWFRRPPLEPTPP